MAEEQTEKQPEDAEGKPEGDEAQQFVEDLRKKAGVDDEEDGAKEGQPAGSDDLMKRLKKSEAELAIGNAKLEALSQAYVELLKNGRSNQQKGPQTLADVDDLLKRSRQEDGTYYSKEQRQ